MCVTYLIVCAIKKVYLLNCLVISNIHAGMSCFPGVQNKDSSSGSHVFHVVNQSNAEHGHKTSLNITRTRNVIVKQ